MHQQLHLGVSCAVNSCKDLADIPTPRLPSIGKDNHVEEPLNGAIVHALDPYDFVCLILENSVAAGWHGERLAIRLELDQGSTFPYWS